MVWLLLFEPPMSPTIQTAPIALDQYRAQRREAVGAAFLAQQRTHIVGASRRRLPRAKVAMPITLHLDEWETDTVTTELSAGGCAFVTGSAPTQHEFRFAIELAPRRNAQGYARVVAIVPRGSQFYVCVSFARLEDAARIAIEERVLGALLAG